MNHLLSKKQLNNEKNRQIRGKSTKIAAAFMQNKANSKNIKISVSSFETGKYEILTAWRSKNQTQSKPNPNPIAEKALIDLSSFMTSKYVKFEDLAGRKTKPKQTQTNPKNAAILFVCILSVNFSFAARPACLTQRLYKRPQVPFPPGLRPRHN